jgi:hypothetical protein
VNWQRPEVLLLGLLSDKQTEENRATRGSAILSREALAHLPAFPLQSGTWIDETFVVYEKTSSVLSFTMSVHEEQLDGIVENPGARAALEADLAESGSGQRTVVVGRYYAGDAISESARVAAPETVTGMSAASLAGVAASRGRGSDSVWWPTVGDERLGEFVDQAARFLEARLESLGCWSSFAEWARCEAGSDLTATTRGRLTPLDYWWLVGETRDSDAVHAVPVYPPEYGLYVPPNDGMIRIYSCMMKAALAQVAYSGSSGLKLQSGPVKCLGCFLGGSAGTLGRATARGALLDECWRIEFVTCETHGHDKPSHFSVSDQGEDYDLVGCMDDGTAPVWIRHSWNTTARHAMTPWV